MLSQRAKGWKWYDWIIVLIIGVLVCAAIVKVAPTTGLAHAVVTVLHGLAALLQLFAGLLTSIATALNSI